MQNAWLRSHIHHSRKHVHHARRQPSAVTHMMPQLASRWHALLNTSAIYIRLGHDRATTANVSQTAAMTTTCNCRLPRNFFEDQASVALPKPCARSGNSDPSHVLKMPLQSFAMVLLRPLTDSIVDRPPLRRACKATAKASEAAAAPRAK